MNDDDELARYQATLLGLLRDQPSPDAVLSALATSPEVAPFRTYALGFERRSVDVAMELVKKWGEGHSGS